MKSVVQINLEDQDFIKLRSFLNDRNSLIQFDLGDQDRIITLGENLASSEAKYTVKIVKKLNQFNQTTYFLVVTDLTHAEPPYEKELKPKIPPDLG